MGEPQQWEVDLQDAIGKVADGALVTKFLVITETIDPDSGEPQLEWFRSEAMSPWDVLGVLRYCTASHEARIEG